jgi:hypothetical protein
MLGDFAGSVIFVCGSLGWVLLATSLFAYAAYCMVVVVTETAAGLDEVRWPSDTMVDWIGQSLRFFIVIATLLIPVGFYLRFLGDLPGMAESAVRFIRVTSAWLWITFPIALLSSMSAGQAYVIVRPAILRDLFRLFPSVVVFYLLTGAGGYCVLLLWYLALVGGEAWVLPVAALAWSTGVLIYARLIGRLGWMTHELGPWRRKPPVGKLKPRLRKRMKVTDPWATPSVEEEIPKAKPMPVAKPAPLPKISNNDDEDDGPATPYEVGNDPLCRPPQFELLEGTPFLEVKLRPTPISPTTDQPSPSPRLFDDEDNSGPVQLAPEDPTIVDTRPTLDITPSTIEMRLTRTEEASPQPPAIPLFSGIYSFPFYAESRWALFVLFVSSLALGMGLFALLGVVPKV